MNRVLFSLIFTFSLSAMADLPVYYWDNQDKLVEANDRCKVETLADQPFRISKYYGEIKNKKIEYENLRNYRGIKQSYVANGTMIKIVEGEKKPKNHLVDIVGVNQSIKRNRWYSDRGDQGYLFYRSVLPLEDYVLKLSNKDIPGIEKTELASHTNTYWSVASGKSFFGLKCPELDRKREYVLFRVYAEGSLAPEMVVAVSSQETSLFKAPKTLSRYDVAGILPDYLLADQSIEYVSLRFRDKESMTKISIKITQE